MSLQQYYTYIGLLVVVSLTQYINCRPQAIHSARLPLDKRYWGDEMSSCIEHYCMQYMNTPDYIKCLQEFCPDAVLVVPSRRSLDDVINNLKLTRHSSPDDLSSHIHSVDHSSPGDLSAHIHSVRPGDLSPSSRVVQCPGNAPSRFCISSVCYTMSERDLDVQLEGNMAHFNGHLETTPDVATSTCLNNKCTAKHGSSLEHCIILNCC